MRNNPHTVATIYMIGCSGISCRLGKGLRGVEGEGKCIRENVWGGQNFLEAGPHIREGLTRGLSPRTPLNL